MNTEKGRKIREHMKEDLLPLQKKDIDKCLMHVVEDYQLDHTRLKNDAALHALLFPYLEERSEDWEGVEGHPEWKPASAAYKHFK